MGKNAKSNEKRELNEFVLGPDPGETDNDNPFANLEEYTIDQMVEILEEGKKEGNCAFNILSALLCLSKEIKSLNEQITQMRLREKPHEAYAKYFGE